MRTREVVLMIGLASSCSVVNAALSTLTHYQREAEAKNEGVQANRAFWAASEADVEFAGALPDPSFSLGHYLENVETRVGPQEDRLGITQKLPWVGKRRLRRDVAAGQSRVTEQKFQASKRDVRYAVTEVFYELVYLKRAIAVTQANGVLLKRFESVAETRLKNGGEAGAVIKAQIELGMLENNILTLESRVVQLNAQLNALINRPPREARVIENKPVFHTDALDVSALKRLGAKNPELKSLAAEVDKSGALLRLAQKQSKPDFVVGLDYIVTGDALNPSADESGKDAVIAKVGLSIPLWVGKNRSRVKAADSRREAVERRYADQYNRMRASAETALFSYSDAQRRAALCKESLIPQAAQSLGIAEDGYVTGKTDFLNLIDAERLQLKFQLLYERARTDAEVALARLEKLIGEDPLNVK